MSDLTASLNEQSIESVRREIAKKIGSRPYFANADTVDSVVTDMDHQPYTRWFRGVYYYPDPIIMEREAGWRPIRNSCYGLVMPPQSNPEPNHCFEVPCTTTFPCYPKYLTKYADKEALDVMINNVCIPQYR
jgi:hypothetical protein